MHLLTNPMKMLSELAMLVPALVNEAKLLKTQAVNTKQAILEVNVQ